MGALPIWLPDLTSVVKCHSSAFDRQRAHFEEEVGIMLSNSQTATALKYQSSVEHLHHTMFQNVLSRLHTDTRNHWSISHSTESNCNWVSGVPGAFTFTIQCTCPPSGMVSSVCDCLDIIIGSPRMNFLAYMLTSTDNALRWRKKKLKGNIY